RTRTCSRSPAPCSPRPLWPAITASPISTESSSRRSGTNTGQTSRRGRPPAGQPLALGNRQEQIDHVVPPVELDFRAARIPVGVCGQPPEGRRDELVDGRRVAVEPNTRITTTGDSPD